MLLAMAQAVVGVVPGRVLCVPKGDCGLHGLGGVATQGHEHDHDHDLDECAGGGHEHVSDACPGHHHGPIAVAVAHSHDGCGCHVHVPLPGEKQLPRGKDVRADIGHLRLVAAVVVVGELDWRQAPACVAIARGGDAYVPLVARALALTSARMLI